MCVCLSTYLLTELLLGIYIWLKRYEPVFAAAMLAPISTDDVYVKVVKMKVCGSEKDVMTHK